MLLQGRHWTWKTWKSLEFDSGTWKTWNFSCLASNSVKKSTCPFNVFLCSRLNQLNLCISFRSSFLQCLEFYLFCSYFILFLFCSLLFHHLLPAAIYLLKVNNRNTRTRCEIYSKLTVKTPERCQRRHWRRSGNFVVDSEHISHHSLVFLLLTLNM